MVRKLQTTVKAARAARQTIQANTPRPIASCEFMPGLLTVEQTCAYLSLGRSSVLNLIYTGQIRRVKYGNRHLVPTAELVRFIERLLEDEYGDESAA